MAFDGNDIRTNLWLEAMREAIDAVFDLTENPTVSSENVRDGVRSRLRQLKAVKDYPTPSGRLRALELLDRRWHEHMDDASPEAYQFTGGLVAAFQALGLISDLEALGYLERIHSCPEAGEHFGNRAWCSYCGSIIYCRYCGRELPPGWMIPTHTLGRIDPDVVGPADEWRFCNRDCRLEYRRRVLQNCRECGIEYDPAPEVFVPAMDHGYCSEKCARDAVAKMYAKEWTEA